MLRLLEKEDHVHKYEERIQRHLNNFNRGYDRCLAQPVLEIVSNVDPYGADNVACKQQNDYQAKGSLEANKLIAPTFLLPSFTHAPLPSLLGKIRQDGGRSSTR